MLKKVCAGILVIVFFGCGSTVEDGDTGDTGDTDANIAALGTQVLFAFNFSILLSNGESDFPEFRYPDSYILPLYLQSNGTVHVRARDLAPMILRVCPTTVSSLECDVFSDAEGIGAGLDLVVDLCGVNNGHAQCGVTDTTVFQGSLNRSGQLILSSLGIRMRVFLLGTSGPEGDEAPASAGGFIPDLPRLNVTVTTGDVNTGLLSGSGQLVTNNQVILVAGGVLPELTISEDLPDLSGYHYLAELAGVFNQNPLNLLAE